MDREIKRTQPSTRCEDCHILYPDPLVARMTMIRDGVKVEKMLCGICALAAANRFDKCNRQCFENELAEQRRLAAVQYRSRIERN